MEFQFDPKNFEIKSRSVMQQLQPLIVHVTTLTNSEKNQRKGRGKSKRAAVLVAAVEQSIQNFLSRGEEIANDYPDVEEEIRGVLQEIEDAGTQMSEASREFAANPCDSEKRGFMVQSARQLLSAVTRLLILADMIDGRLLLQAINAVQASLQKLQVVGNHDQLIEELNNYHQRNRELLQQAGRRQQEMVDPHLRDDIASARAVLKKSSAMLMAASRAYVQHSDIPAAKANRDQILRQICEAINTIEDAAQGKVPQEGSGRFEGIGKIATNLDTLEQTKHLDYTEITTKQLLQQQLDELVTGVTTFSDGNIKDERKEKILAGCNALRDALQNLLSQSLKRPEDNQLRSDVVNTARNLRRQLGKAMADKITEGYSGSPLYPMIAAAQQGDTEAVEEYAPMFAQYANNLMEIAHEVCELSNNEDGIKMVRYAASELDKLYPQVVNAARILAAQPHSQIAQENMATFLRLWEDQMQLLLDAVDDIVIIDDVLSALDSQIINDINQYAAAVEDRNPQLIQEYADKIRAHMNRITNITASEMDNYEPCVYTTNVLEAIKVLNEDIMQKFETTTNEVLRALDEGGEIDENAFLDATQLVYNGVRDVRRAVLMNRADEDLDPEEVELEETTTTTITETVSETVIEQTEDLGGLGLARKAMDDLPEEKKTKILEQVENFKSEKESFDREIAKWDEAHNDIIVLAKYMCTIMIEMTEFVSQKGPLKTTTDVINAAKKLSENGTKLDQLTREIADVCPEGTIKSDLLAYIERVNMHSVQINIISKVKADVESINEDVILAGVESATALIENAKNLMNAVVLTVKASYVASTKLSRQGTLTTPIVWKMKAPEKKPLVILEKPQKVTVVRKASQRKTHNPVKILSQFQI